MKIRVDMKIDTKIMIFVVLITIGHIFVLSENLNAQDLMVKPVMLEKSLLSGLDKFKWEETYNGGGSIIEVTKDDLFDFVKKSGYIDSAAIDMGRVTIPEIEIKELNKDGVYDIAFPIDLTCTGCPTIMWILSYKKNQIYLYQFSTEWGSTKNDIKDLNSDGQFEIITHRELATSNSHAEAVVWDDIYSWDGNQYVKSGEKYPDYYVKEYIPRYGKRLDTALKVNIEVKAKERTMDDAKEIEWATEWKENEISDVQLAIDKAKRVAGIDPRAGLNQALTWTRSKNKNLRLNAIKVFEDIKDQQSIEMILKLSDDSNSWVRSNAAISLSHIDKDRFLPVFKKLLNDPYQAPVEKFGPDSFPVRETAKSILDSMGIKVKGEKGQFVIENESTNKK